MIIALCKNRLSPKAEPLVSWNRAGESPWSSRSFFLRTVWGRTTETILRETFSLPFSSSEVLPHNRIELSCDNWKFAIQVECPYADSVAAHEI